MQEGLGGVGVGGGMHGDARLQLCVVVLPALVDAERAVQYSIYKALLPA